MPNVQTRTRFTCDSAYIAEMRHTLEKDAESVRRGYFELVLQLEESLWTERLLREKVLMGDELSRIDRLWGCQLADHTRRREIPKISVAAANGLEVGRKFALTLPKASHLWSGNPFKLISRYRRRKAEEELVWLEKQYGSTDKSG